VREREREMWKVWYKLVGKGDIASRREVGGQTEEALWVDGEGMVAKDKGNKWRYRLERITMSLWPCCVLSNLIIISRMWGCLAFSYQIFL
jgi:hypothetical protein